MSPQQIDLQQKIETAIATAIADTGYEAVWHHRFQNVGACYVQPTGTLDTRLGVAFDFQDDAVTFQVYPGTLDPKRTIGFTDPRCLMYARLAYTDGVGLRQFLTDLQDLILGPGPIRTTAGKGSDV